MAMADPNTLVQPDPVGDQQQAWSTVAAPVLGLTWHDDRMNVLPVPASHASVDTAAQITVVEPGRLVPGLNSDCQLPIAEGLIPLQSWEGVVLEVNGNSFAARLADMSGEHQDEEVEVSKEELSEFDLELLERGAVFYWTIGYRQRLPKGARERVSRIRFRRLPAWSKAELTATRERAETLSRELGW
jgi:hypothetical protein